MTEVTTRAKTTVSSDQADETEPGECDHLWRPFGARSTALWRKRLKGLAHPDRPFTGRALSKPADPIALVDFDRDPEARKRIALGYGAMSSNDKAEFSRVFRIPPESLLINDDASFEKIVDWRRGEASAALSIFDCLALFADPGLALEFRYEMSDLQIDQTIVAKRAFEITATLPVGLDDCQVLAFERDCTGEVCLLSSCSLVRSNPRYRKIVRVPRPGLVGERPTGSVSLAVDGSSEIMLVVARNEAVRFDLLPFFRRTASDRGEVAAPSLGVEDLRIVARALFALPRGDWTIAMRALTVVGSRDEPRLSHKASTGRSLFAESALRWQGVGKPCAPAVEEARIMSDVVDVRPSLSLAKRTEGERFAGYPADLAARLSRHSAAVRELAASGSLYGEGGAPAPFMGWRDHDDESEFSKRLDLARDLGLFVVGGGRPGVEAILETQAVLAWRAHGLRYDRKGVSWIEADANEPFGRRSKNYLDRMKIGDCASFPKIDMALISHCFGLPLDLWEIDEFDLFAEYLERESARRLGEAEGKLLLDFEPFDYLRDRARQGGGSLFVTTDEDCAAHAGHSIARNVSSVDPVIARNNRAANISHAAPNPLKANARLWAWMKLDFSPGVNEAASGESAASPVECLLFEIDGEGVTLVSNFHETKGSIAYEDGWFETPRVAGGGMAFAPGTSAFVLVVAKRLAAACERLQALDVYQTTQTLSRNQAPPYATPAQIEALRKALMRRAADSWRAYVLEGVEFVEDVANRAS